MKERRLRDLAVIDPSSTRFVAADEDARVAFVPMEGVTETGLVLEERARAEVATGYTRFEDGDVLLPKIAPTFSHGRVVVAEDLPGGFGTGTTELIVLRPRADLDARWLRYALLTDRFIQEGCSTYYGVAGQKRISGEWMGNFRLQIPSVPEQLRVVEALDTACDRISTLLAETKRQEALLWERRRAVVYAGVSGATVAGDRRPGPPWIESIPADWLTARLSRLARLGSGHTPARNRPELWEDCTVPWVTTGEVAQIRSDVVEVLHYTREMISEIGIRESAAVVHPEGTVVLCRTAASAGYSAIMGGPMATSQDFATWTCRDSLEPAYLLYCLRAMRPDLLGRLAIGSTHKTIYMPEIKSITVPVPPPALQRQIVEDIRADIARLDALRTEVSHQAALLREHRRALITDAMATKERTGA